MDSPEKHALQGTQDKEKQYKQKKNYSTIDTTIRKQTQIT